MTANNFKKKLLRSSLGKLAVPLAALLFGVLLVSCYLYMRGEDVRYAQTIDRMVATERLLTIDSRVRAAFHRLHEITNISTLFIRNNPTLTDQDFFRLVATVIASGTGDMVKDMALVRKDGHIITTPGTTPKRVKTISTGIRDFVELIKKAQISLPNPAGQTVSYAYALNRIFCLAPVYAGDEYWGYVLYAGELYDLFSRTGIEWSDENFDYCIQVHPHPGQQRITWGATNLLREQDEHTFVQELPYGDIKWSFILRNKHPLNVPENFRIRDLIATLFILITVYLFWLHLKSFAQTRERERRDQLTGTLNHTHFFTRAERLMRKSEPMTLYIMDLNSFKQINDTYGHPLGDETLKAVAARLKSLTGDGDLISRIGGDEFALLINGSSTEEEAERFVKEAQAAVSRPLEKVPGIIPEISVGYALVPREGIKCSTLYPAADERMYQRKKQMKEAEAVSPVAAEI